MDLAVELQKIYDSEINVEIGWFSDGGIVEIRLGDKMSGTQCCRPPSFCSTWPKGNVWSDFPVARHLAQRTLQRWQKLPESERA